MTAFFTLLSPVGTISIIFLFFILARLSEKLGAVTRMPAYYRWFGVGIGFLGIALISQLLRITVSLTGQTSYPVLNDPLFYLATYYLPMAIGVTIGLAVTWRYWSWLLTERDG
jgi:lipopolysaccharide export LptBFGC system permease protein LptF